MREHAMLPAPLRYALLAAIVICNVLFFWDVEIKGESLLALTFGPSSEKSDQEVGPRLTQTRIEQTRAYTFSNPAAGTDSNPGRQQNPQR